ncbi:helix-turn-helix domain-containing protein [Rhodococcus hoagii]|nr:helix-turn-helix domain-containing protein [Prescottella equi]
MHARHPDHAARPRRRRHPRARPRPQPGHRNRRRPHGRARHGRALEYERELLAERTREGLAHARAQGRTGGRRPSLTPQQVEAITATLAAGMSIRDVATMHGVSERTISRVRAGIYGQSKRPQT